MWIRYCSEVRNYDVLWKVWVYHIKNHRSPTVHALYEWNASVTYVSLTKEKSPVSSGFLPQVIHYNDVKMGTIASQITSLTIVYSMVYPGADQRKCQSSASLAFVRVIHRGPVNFPHKWPVTRKMFPFDDVIMSNAEIISMAWRRHTTYEDIILILP